MINRNILSQEEIDALLKQFFKESLEGAHQASETQDSAGVQSIQKTRQKREKGFEEE
jgi:flagellar motor switch protein FliM